MRFIRSIATRLRTAFGGRPGRPSRGKFRPEEFGGVLGYRIVRRELFLEALSHRSYTQNSGGPGTLSNERLEFLGDAVLNLLVAEHLFGAYADSQEGELTKVRARLVNRRALVVYARNIDLERYLLMSPQTDQVSDRGMETILADAFEAVIGAIYLDGGYEHAREFVGRKVIEPFRRGEVGALDDNYKSMLLEHAQGEGWGVPRYVTVDEKGPDHDRTFTVEVQIGHTSRGRGTGKNKKDAEQAAARSALTSLRLIG